MGGVERKTISFDEGECQAVEAVLGDQGVLEAFYGRVGKVRHHVATGGVLFDVGDLGGPSFSDTVRALVRIGLDTVDHEYMARQYQAAAPAMSAALADPGVASLLATSNRMIFGDASGFAGEVAGDEPATSQPQWVAASPRSADAH